MRIFNDPSKVTFLLTIIFVCFLFVESSFESLKGDWLDNSSDICQRRRMVGTTILFIYGLISFYTIILLRYCLDSEFDLKTYPDSAQAAFLPRDVSLSR
ncbi:hypothetical protein YC2023_110746 [Brassica napus]